MKKSLLFLPLVFLLAACTDTANRKEAENVQRQQRIYNDSQPAPFFDWSLERHMLIELYKARNNAVVTYSYVRNLNGQVIFSCKSIGFPIPSNTQLTNPEAREVYVDKDGNSSTVSDTVLPQAEPNGTYTSPSTAGTYVFCLNDDGTVSPSYFEADVEAHTMPLSADAKEATGEATLKIETKKK